LIAGGALDSDLERLLGSWGVDLCGMEDDEGFAHQIQQALAGKTSHASPERFQRDALAHEYSELLHTLGPQTTH